MNLQRMTNALGRLEEAVLPFFGMVVMLMIGTALLMVIGCLVAAGIATATGRIRAPEAQRCCVQCAAPARSAP